MFVKKFDVKLMCQLALLVALYYLLSITLVIHTGNFKLTFISLPVIAAALLYGPGAGFTVALLGEFLAQMSGPYGLAPTTVLYVAPAAIRGVVVGLGTVWCRQTGRRIESRPVACYAICIAGAVLTTLGNTVSIWLESVMYHTEFMVHIPFLPGRFATGIATAVIMTTVCIPLVHALRRSGVVKYAD